MGSCSRVAAVLVGSSRSGSSTAAAVRQAIPIAAAMAGASLAEQQLAQRLLSLLQAACQ